MGRYSAVIVLMVLSTGCMHDKKPETQPQPVATPPAAKAPEGSKAPTAPAAKKPTSTAKAKPADSPSAKPPAGPPAKQAATPPAKPAPATTKTTPPKPAAATLDLDGLETRLKDTKAIGLMTKLSLKNKVDDLLDEFRKHYAGSATPTMAELRRSYDLLMMKVLSLLQDRDQKLASDILSSRERIWGLLANPNSFAALTA